MAKRLNTERFIKKANTINKKRYLYDNTIYEGYSVKVVVTCKEHGDFLILPKKHLEGFGCKECVKKEKYEKKFGFVDKAKETHGKIYNYKNTIFVNNKEHVVITCKKHGDFKQLPLSHLGGSGCPKCRLSKGETAISKFLLNNNIKFTREKKFRGCGKRRFDFYLKETNTCIEYDGIHHFEAVKFFGGEKAFKRIKDNDIIKDEFCVKKNINLIRIPYTDLPVLENVLTKFLLDKS